MLAGFSIWNVEKGLDDSGVSTRAGVTTGGTLVTGFSL